ncbi:HET-domain-containing protein [Plenodomus tracheiphilus IPT5]|uniref:HET-domain-containing protein n=1 Tax=Plenodomus tracheiphilus IPT5 TaxID=1408161 RepID=A0A6A7AT82_9PLEO|nr:HET-domain-containing protein [Plenodomus tracheiphilus IPT5]
MPLPKSLRRPVRRASSSSTTKQSQRKRCSICNNLDPRNHQSSVYQTEASKDPRASLHLVIDTFTLIKTKDASKGGCRFCIVLILALDAFLGNWRGARTKVNLELREKGTVKINLDGDRWKNEIVEIYAGSASRRPWPTLGTAHHIPTDSGSDDTFNFIRRCIQGCIANPKHTACRPAHEPVMSAPKRLLDVGRVSSPIRLIDTQGKSFQYATLSHCWGSASLLKTTKANWQKLAANIPFDALPPLFQDAIVITRQLGLRYIWIDSLCIVQDSVRDWEAESSRMGSIYQNSYITISATNSGDGSARCLAQRRKPVKIPYENTTSKEFSLRARRILDHHPSHSSNGGPAKLVGPLTFRAWALQEHVLSTRIVHYTETELLFECKTSYRCECMPDRKAYPTTPALIPRAVASKKASTIWQAWQRIVEQYSTRNLTVASDKLPAISGIASKIRKATHSDYLAGLWKGNLALDLLWQASPSGLDSFALDKWRAPSWSWASLDTAISYTTLEDAEFETFSPVIVVGAARIVPSGLNILGTLTSASLSLRGPTISATLSSDQNKGAWIYTLFIKGTSSITISHDCILCEAKVKTEGGNEQSTVRRARSGDAPRAFKAPIVCITIARYDNVIAGLVLGVSVRDPHTWERLGTFAAGNETLQNIEEREMILI